MGRKSKSHRSRSAKRDRAALKPPGAPPGMLAAEPGAPKPAISVFAYGPDRATEAAIARPEVIREYLEAWPVTWVNVDGLGDAATIEAIGAIFGLHRLALEDVLHVRQRPKAEDYPGETYIVVRAADLGERLETEQISIFLGRNYVLTFQERAGDAFDPVRERIRHGKGRIRGAGPDYLAYALLDATVDAYFPILEELGERLDAVEDEIIASSRVETIARVHALKRDLHTLRRTLWPMRDALNSLLRDEECLFTSETRIYLRDCYDHLVRLIELAETQRELGSDLVDLYLSNTSNRMNEIMKVLTVITTIFIPLSFIAGVYGMNFDPDASRWNMPELRWVFGYPFSLGLMAVVAAVLIVYFRKKGWL